MIWDEAPNDFEPLRWEDVANTPDSLQVRVDRFLTFEASLQDDNRRLWDWFGLLTDDFEYIVPVRINRESRSKKPIFGRGYHVKDDASMIRRRIERVDTEHAWAEEPPSRLRRVVSNGLISQIDSAGIGQEYDVQTSFLVYRARLNDPSGDLLAGHRRDILVDTDGGLKLKRRIVFLDHTTIPTSNLSFFL